LTGLEAGGAGSAGITLPTVAMMVSFPELRPSPPATLWDETNFGAYGDFCRTRDQHVVNAARLKTK